MDKNNYLQPNQLKSPEASELMASRKLVIAHAKYGMYHSLINTNPDFARWTVVPQAAAKVVNETVARVVPVETEKPSMPIAGEVIYDMEKERGVAEQATRVQHAQELVSGVFND